MEKNLNELTVPLGAMFGIEPFRDWKSADTSDCAVLQSGENSGQAHILAHFDHMLVRMLLRETEASEKGRGRGSCLGDGAPSGAAHSNLRGSRQIERGARTYERFAICQMGGKALAASCTKNGAFRALARVLGESEEGLVVWRNTRNRDARGLRRAGSCSTRTPGGGP